MICKGAKKPPSWVQAVPPQPSDLVPRKAWSHGRGWGVTLVPVLVVTMAASTLELRPRVELISPTQTVWGVRNVWVQHGGSAWV